MIPMPLVLKAVLLYYSPGKIWEHSSISSYYETPRIIATRTSSCNETSRMNNCLHKLLYDNGSVDTKAGNFATTRLN